MGQTGAEKIIARTAGRREVSPGDIVWIKPDLTGACGSVEPDTSITSVIPDLHTLVGVDRVKHPEKHVLIIDHCSPAGTVHNAEYQAESRKWGEKNSIKVLETWSVGIDHHALVDTGLVRPGMLYAHNDTEVTLLGGIGALAIGTLPLLEIYTTGQTWLRVPPTTKISLTGKLPHGVMSRDAMHMIVGKIGPDGVLNQVVEFDGTAVQNMAVDGRITMCSMANHAGAKSAWVDPDPKTIDYIRSVTPEPFQPVFSDPDAVYRQEIHFNVSNLEPFVAAPHSVDNCRPIKEVEGEPIDQGYIGSCGGGRLEDLRAAARILNGRKIHPKVRLFIVPSTSWVLKRAEEEGLLKIFIESGAFISSPTCNFCAGRNGALAAEETAITTGVLNVRGRHGSMNSRIFLASAYSIAAAALEGRITDPRMYI